MASNVIEVAPLHYNVAFKKAFGQVDVFNAFVRDVLNIEFEVDEVIQEYSYHEQIGRVLSRDGFAPPSQERITPPLTPLSLSQHNKKKTFLICHPLRHLLSCFFLPLTLFLLQSKLFLFPHHPRVSDEHRAEKPQDV